MPVGYGLYTSSLQETDLPITKITKKNNQKEVLHDNGSYFHYRVVIPNVDVWIFWQSKLRIPFHVSLAWARTNHKESGGIIKGFTLLVDKTLIYS